MTLRWICLASLCASCAPSWNGAVRDSFATTYACPGHRQTVRRVQPPPEIAADPERRAIWDHAHHVYDVEGCGRTATIECAVVGGDALNPWVDCTPVAPLAETARR